MAAGERIKKEERDHVSHLRSIFRSATLRITQGNCFWIAPASPALRRLTENSLSPASEALEPRLLDMALLIRAPGELRHFNPPEQRAAQRTLPACRPTGIDRTCVATHRPTINSCGHEPVSLPRRVFCRRDGEKNTLEPESLMGLGDFPLTKSRTALFPFASGQLALPPRSSIADLNAPTTLGLAARPKNCVAHWPAAL